MLVLDNLEKVYLNNTEKIFAWFLVCSVILGFALYALVLCRQNRQFNQGNDTVEFFLTARNTQPALRVAWSFVAGGLGAWVLSLPAGNARESGVIGVLAYSLFSGIPIFLVAILGNRIQKKYPNVLGFCDYVYLRFGRGVQIYVTLIMLFNIGIGLAAEYTTISAIFQHVMNQSGLTVVFLIGIATMFYTAFGGLLVSILTDQYQAVFGTSLIGVLVLFFLATFQYPTKSFPTELGPNQNGYNLILTLPISLFCATVFSEAPWQRALASESPIALKRGAFVGSIAISIVVLIFGLLGIFAVWEGCETEDPNALILSFFSDNRGASPFLIILVLILAVIMCESAVDTAQNALVNTVSSMFLKDKPIIWSRVAVLFLNTPLMAISIQGFNTFTLFMLGNKITSTSALPLILGLCDISHSELTGTSVLFSSGFSFVSVLFYGCLAKNSFSRVGIYYALFDPYDPGSFLVAIIASFFGVYLWIFIKRVHSKFIPRYFFQLRAPYQPLVSPATSFPSYSS